MGTVDTTTEDLSGEVAKEVQKHSPTPEQAKAIHEREQRWLRQTSGVGTIEDLPPEGQPVQAAQITQPQEAEESEGSEEPAGNASTDEWRAYRKAQGYSEDELNDKDGKPLGRKALRGLKDR